MTKLPLVREKAHELLELGDKYRLPPDCVDPRTYEVLRVGAGSLTVRTVSHQEHVEFQTAAGAEVDFARAGRRFQICRRPIGIVKVST